MKRESNTLQGWLTDYGGVRERAMRTLFDALDALCEGTVIIDRECRIVWMNARYAARFGVAGTEQAIGRVIEDVIPSSLLREVVRTGQPILLDVMETGKESFVVIRLPLRDEQGEVIGAVGFALFDRLQPLAPLFSKYQRLQDELSRAQRSLAEARRTKYTFSNFVGDSAASLAVKRLARRASQVDAPVLLLGETGTGKEILAHAIHAASPRAHRPFVSVNVAAIPDNLLEAEFFGVAPGAYTGAERRTREGKFQLAEGGTLFLDEIGEMPLALQAKLLRAIQEREVEPLGSNRVLRVDVRIIAATCADLSARVADGRFRADLYYRLNVLAIPVPPLRERSGDLALLCEHMLEEIALRNAQPHCELEPAALALLGENPWPGNVRELGNVLEKAVLMSENQRLSVADIAAVLPPGQKQALPAARGSSAAVVPYAQAMAEAELRILRDALDACDGRASEAARRLGIGRATFYRRLALLGETPKK